MAEYTPIFEPFYTDGWENQPSENTPIMGEALDAYDKVIQKIEDFLNELSLKAGYFISGKMLDYTTLYLVLQNSNYSNVATKSINLGLSDVPKDMSFADGILTLTYKNGTTKEVDITSLLDLITPDITTTDQTTLPNSHSGRIKIEHIGGNMEQKSTTGAQLLNPDKSHGDIKISDSGYNMSLTGKSAWAQAGIKITNIEVGQTMYASMESITNSIVGSGFVAIQQRDADANILSTSYLLEGKFSVNFTVVENAVELLVLLIANGSADELESDNTITVKGLMLSETEGNEWEPYMGGKPSPSPECPQPIKPVTGKNLLDCRGLEEQTVNGVTFTPVYDENGNLLLYKIKGSRTGEGTLRVTIADVTLEKGDYYVSGCNDSSASFYGMFDNGDGTYTIQNKGLDVLLSLKEKTTINYYFIALEGAEVDTELYPMIRPASVVDDTYVPYGLIRIKGHGKNFVNISDKTFTNNTYFVVDMPCFLPKGTYTVHAKCDNVVNVLTDFYVSDINNNPIFRLNGVFLSEFVNGNYQTFTIDEDCYYLTWYINNTAGYTFTISDFSIMEGDTGTDYKPYTEQSIILSQPMKLYGNEDVQDVITPRNSERKYGVKLFDGSDDEGITLHPQNGYFVCQVSNHKSRGFCLCNIASYNQVTSVNNTCRLGNAESFSITTDAFSTVAEFKNYLQANPMTVVYELAESTTTKLPTADQISLNSLLSYDGITYVEFDTEIQPTWSAKYGTSEVGGYTLESLLTARNNELKQELALERITALEATLVNNI